MSTTTLPVSIRARIVQIERDHAEPNFSTVNHYWKHEGLKYKDALHAEELERELDRLDALAAAVGLSEEQRAERSQVAAELDRFVQAARCHADRTRSEPARSERTRSERTRSQERAQLQERLDRIAEILAEVDRTPAGELMQRTADAIRQDQLIEIQALATGRQAAA